MTWHKDRPCKCPRCIDCGHEQARPVAAHPPRWWCASCNNLIHQGGFEARLSALLREVANEPVRTFGEN